MDWSKLKHRAQQFYDRLPIALGFLMSLILIVQGIYGAIKMDENGEYALVEMLSCITMFVGGSLVLLFCVKKDLIRCIGTYALSLGLSRILLRYGFIDWGNPLTVILGILIIIIPANLCYTGISFTLGNVIRRTSMRWATS